MSNYKGAVKDYTKVIELNPDNATIAYEQRAHAYEVLKENDKAIADYQKAADLYQKQGNTKDYQEALEQIKKLQ